MCIIITCPLYSTSAGGRESRISIAPYHLPIIVYRTSDKGVYAKASIVSLEIIIVIQLFEIHEYGPFESTTAASNVRLYTWWPKK
jgi:hypothetical protein